MLIGEAAVTNLNGIFQVFAINNTHNDLEIKLPKCELTELKIRPSTGPILAAISWPMLLDQYQRSNQPSVVPVMARYIGNQNLPCFRRSLAQQWHFNGLEVGITPANCVVSQKDRVRPTNGSSQVQKSSLLQQTMLDVKNYESGPVRTLDWAESRHYSGTPCCKSKSQCPAH